MDKKTPVFSEKTHAILFALIARQVITRYGDEAGVTCLRKALRRYGEQRGRRMAMRALANGDALTMFNFLVYGEWRNATAGGEIERAEDETDIRMTIRRCPWADAWIETELLQYGRYYCQEIDAALLRGFNPQLRIEVSATLSNEGTPCEFIYHQAVQEAGQGLAVIGEKAARLESQRVAPWEYHCGHLYQACSLAAGEDFGAPGRVIVQSGLVEFGLRFGGSASGTIADYLKTNFDKLPR